MDWPQISRSMLKNSLLLGAFAVLSVGTVAAIHYSTAERIAVAEREAKVQALAQILPPGSYDNDLLDSVREVEDPLLGNKGPTPAYLATLNGQPAAVIVQATAPDGYSGSIQLLIGIFADGRIAGVRVLSHKETPGLGDKIELAKDRWISRFTDTSLSAPDDSGWAVKKDGGQFDQFAGATITPRAVVAAVHRALQYFNAQRASLLQVVEAKHG
ncbi:electron transport complex subunit RsxG [Pseudomonas sp. 5P_3.1_Bac2]|uniref:electron transport complex subunit RsxG n=1 Tax=Pseudomonas sp. 5P_3.1_Bac2 TaxID=2971617 RepID=UPI0021CA7C93|nr:electron transport complex subunit RsxG [Pseudomonas sp. 5P_3.1_Bac2]MCU1716069.1 electron transport complex subunit RsxG [Pseudomonas sp. 5P_3.1_Bac2]